MRHRRWILVCCCAGTIATTAVLAQSVSFLPHKDLPFGNGTGCCSIVSGDFNGDGKLDLVVGDGQSNFTILLGDGAGGFVAKSIGVVDDKSAFGPDSRVIAAADLNNDGKLDLLIFGHSANSYATYVLFGNGDATFKTPVSVISGPVSLVADFNRDGIPDLLVYEPSGFAVSFGNGDGTFRQPSATMTFTQPFPHSVVAGDFNGDGKLDVAWGHSWHDGSPIEIWLGNGDGTFRHTLDLLTSSYYSAKPMAVADFNHDGKPDLAVFLSDIPAVEVFLGNGDGTFRSGFVMPVLAGGGLVAADFNGDGNVDLATGAAVLLGNGDGTFQVPAYFPYGHPYGVVSIAADLHGNGRPDLVLTPGFGQDFRLGEDPSPAISLLPNDSPGNPASVTAVSAVTGAEAIAPASLSSIYGSHLSSTTAIADSPTWPTVLGGTRVHIRDSSNVERLAQLVYVSPAQINFLVPKDTATGWAIITIDNGTTPFVEGTRATPVNSLAPGFFTLDERGMGVPAATAVRVLADGTQQPVAVFSCNGTGSCSASPIELSGADVYLSLYGTGFRGASYTYCTMRERFNPRVTFSGPQPTVTGLDQLNMLLPANLPPGAASLHCDFSGNNSSGTSNDVEIVIK